jgi:3-oxoacyl-[acyl-carrier-protein] synthase II
MRRAVVTGIGVVSPLGCDLKRFWERIREGRSGIRRITKFDAAKFESQIAGEVVEFDPDVAVDKKQQRRMDEFSILAMGAAKSAVTDSGLSLPGEEDPERVGVVVASGIGGLRTLEIQHASLVEKGPSRCSPFMIPQMIIDMAGGLIAIAYNAKGPNYACVSACASAAHSMGDALRLIQREEVDIKLTGGAEASVTTLGVGGFCAMRALSTRNDQPEKASRPFEANRDGFVIADGAAVLVVEELEHARKRGARIYAEVAGFGMTCDAYHMTAPDESGAGAARAMKLAMKDAELRSEDVDYVNAHGTSTQLNDKMETRAIKLALGEERARQVMVSSTKSMTGHLLGAAGGIEAAICVLGIRDGVVPPTINYETPDPDCDLDYVPNIARSAGVKASLSNSFGFGGHNACLAFRAV